MVRLSLAVFSCLVGSASVQAHGHITWPPARTNGTLDLAGNCENFACVWFSQVVEIPGEPTLPDYARTYNVNVTSGDDDWSRKMPWRAPGTAPVYGSGCGAAGGGPIPLDNGGFPPPGVKQGFDGILMPESPITVWKRGSVQEVAHAMFANHGGGYSWRLCPKNDANGKSNNITEECFLENTLEFDGDKQWIRFKPMYQWDQTLRLPDFEIDAVRVNEGTYPNGSHWTRNPVPGCFLCDQAECMRNFSKFDDQQHCSQACSGLNITGRTCPPGMTQFPEPAGGISGYYAMDCVGEQGKGGACDGMAGFDYNVVDKVKIPKDIDAGDYLLSWRWDCEQSRQIWQNCADLRIE